MAQGRGHIATATELYEQATELGENHFNTLSAKMNLAGVLDD